ncbi:MAG TPA: histidine kinase [Bryobacteraceae bacterium]|nr:histidine kinase [Bryobacteraceae bacterium]
MVRARAHLWSLAIWMAFGLMNGAQVVVGMHAEGMQHPWFRLFLRYALSWVVWGAVSPLVIALGRRFPPHRHWPTHVAAYAGIVAVDGVWVYLLNIMLQPYGPPSPGLLDTLAQFLYARFPAELIAYACVLALGYTIDARKRLAEREEQLAKARLDALKRQLEPHFLFNTLNGIAGLVRSGQNRAAVDMIVGLSDLLRRVVDGASGAETTLAEEMEFLDSYLKIQQARFAGRLRVAIDVPGELLNARVPSMILQPLVENAIQHGIALNVQGGSLWISARRDNGCLRMSVENDGALDVAREGVGVGNTRARLRNMYGDAASLELRNGDAGAVEAVVSVPYLAAR